jgi:hypothetical protein
LLLSPGRPQLAESNFKWWLSMDTLYCASCGRSTEPGPNHTDTVTFLEAEWCQRCAKTGRLTSGTIYVDQPSPGRMYSAPSTDALNAWLDCYSFQPKRRIKVDEARQEIQRTWKMWDGDKSAGQAMFLFYGWLARHRPYFLTFRYKHDPWQRVHSWLIQVERSNK